MKKFWKNYTLIIAMQKYFLFVIVSFKIKMAFRRALKNLVFNSYKGVLFIHMYLGKLHKVQFQVT